MNTAFRAWRRITCHRPRRCLTAWRSRRRINLVSPQRKQGFAPLLALRAAKALMNLERTPTRTMTYSPLLWAWSILTCGVAFLTVIVGTLVTTFHVGMTDPLWPTAPWHLLLIERVPNFGFYVEHTHRIVGSLIGICILVQTVALWWSSPRRWRRGAAIAFVGAILVAFIVGLRSVTRSPRSLDALGNAGFVVVALGAVVFLMLAG